MISIIGAGPAGTHTAYLLAKNNQDVTVYEEHKDLGKPIQCSGVITPALDNLLKIKKDIIVNKIKKVRFYAPNDKFFELNIKPDYVFDRAKLDNHIADLARKEGVKFKTKRFLDLENKTNKIKLKFNDGFIETDKLIGADGPYSQVAKSANMFGTRNFIVGMQARAKTKHNKNTVDIFLGYGEFGWLIPEDEYNARIGVVSEKDPKVDFQKLMNKCNAKFLNYQSGMIPLYNSKIKTQKNNIYLIGDAATQVKAATHGGILYSMIASKALTKAIVGNKNYDALWRKDMGFDLWLNLKIRNTLLNFSHKDYNNLVNYFSQNKLRNILSSHVRDFPSRFMLKVLLAEPRLLKYTFKAI